MRCPAVLSARSLSPNLSSLIDAIVHPSRGLITDIYEEHPRDSGIYLVHALMAPPAYFRRNLSVKTPSPDNGIGCSFDRERAVWSAIGEACERYSAAIYDPEALRLASAEELGADALDLESLIRVGRPEVHPFASDHLRYWAAGRDLIDGRLQYVPAAMAFLGYEPSSPDETIAQNDSTGLACGQTLDDACLGALCEVIERDAFASNWLLSRSPPKIQFDDRDLEALSIGAQNALKNPSVDIALHYLGQPYGVHVVTSVVTAAGVGTVAAAASPSVTKAIEKAIAEGLHTWTGARKLAKQSVVERIEDVRSPADHTRFYLSPERFALVRDVLSDRNTIPFSEVAVADTVVLDAKAISEALANDGYRAVLVDLTTADIDDLGLKVVRVVVPGLQPLVFGPSCVHVIDPRRLERWRVMWELRPGPFNPQPHPFP